MTILIQNALVYDGSGSAPRKANVFIENDQIRAVGACENMTADVTIDAEGLSLAPGFIDAHSHNDWFAIKKDPLPYFEPFIRQGITTFVAGNCGLSAAGYDKGNPHKDKIGGGLFFYDGAAGDFPGFQDYFRHIDNNAPCNMSVLAGHCTARAAASGSVNRPLTSDEETKMLSLIEDALRNGAAGVSLGLMYDPGLYASKEELIKVAELCKKYNRPLTVHPRANSAVSMSYPELLGRSHLLRAVDELTEIARKTGVKLHYSHAIFVGRRSFKDKDEFVSIMNALRSEGIDAMFDIYNELQGVSVITVILPAWYQAMSEEERNKPLTKLKLSVLVKASSLLLGFGFKDIEIAYIGKGFEKYEGKTVHEIAREEGMSDLNAYLMLCKLSDFKGRVNMGPYTTPEIISDFEKNPNCLYMTDAWVEDHGVQNPAIYDCFPKFLRDSLIGTGDTLSNTIRKMTGATADRFQIPNRGYIKEGYFADLTLFSEEEIKTATPDQTQSFGIKRVFINGKEVLSAGTLTENAKNAGRAIPITE